jgi:hypothetical protein
VNRLRLRFRQVWLADFEFGGPPGDPQQPRCLVAHELFSGLTVRMWEDEMRSATGPPYAVSDDALFIAFYASAEFKCHLPLGWTLPENAIDLYAEFRVHTNGQTLVAGKGLLGALTYFGLDAMAACEKDSMRELAMRGGPYTAEEKRALLDYCAEDVDALRRLLPAMLPTLDIDRALIRGDYMKALARMEHTGVPLDAEYLEQVRAEWDNMKLALVARIDKDFDVFEGATFKRDRFEQFIRAGGISWPRLASGQLQLDEETFRAMARAYPVIGPLHDLRVSLGQLRLAELEVGTDGRNRTMLSAFSTRTGRNAPSTTRFVFGPAKWIRGFIRPAPRMALAYIDYVSEEFGIAAALSRDMNMRAAYATGDPHLAFAVQAGAAPPDATRDTHGEVRDRFKACNLGVLFGMGALTLGQQVSLPTPYARDLIRVHQETYSRYWRWSNGAVDHAMLLRGLHTVFGWRIGVGPDSRPASLRNWPVQSTGAEILRLAACMLTDAGICVCAPVHDAFLIQAPLDLIKEHVRLTKALMVEAARIVLGGFELRTDVTIIRYPDRFMDKRGAKMWTEVQRLLAERSGQGRPR